MRIAVSGAAAEMAHTISTNHLELPGVAENLDTDLLVRSLARSAIKKDIKNILIYVILSYLCNRCTVVSLFRMKSNANAVISLIDVR